jgi:archaellum component FlaC
MTVMAPRETWTDERLDDFRTETRREFSAVRAEMRTGFDQVDKRFDRMDAKFDKIEAKFEKVDEKFDGITERLESLQRTLIITLGMFGSGLLVTLAGLVVTQH